MSYNQAKTIADALVGLLPVSPLCLYFKIIDIQFYMQSLSHFFHFSFPLWEFSHVCAWEHFMLQGTQNPNQTRLKHEKWFIGSIMGQGRVHKTSVVIQSRASACRLASSLILCVSLALLFWMHQLCSPADSGHGSKGLCARPYVFEEFTLWLYLQINKMPFTEGMFKWIMGHPYHSILCDC